MGRIKETSRDSEAFGTGNGGELLPPLGLGSWKLWQEGCLSQGGTEGKHRQWPTLQWCRGGRGINTAASPVDFSSPANASHSLFFARPKSSLLWYKSRGRRVENRSGPGSQKEAIRTDPGLVSYFCCKKLLQI